MSAEHYWLSRIHGMAEAAAIVESCLRVGMDVSSALETVDQIAGEIRFDLTEGNKWLLSARFIPENLEELPVDLLKQVRQATESLEVGVCVGGVLTSNVTYVMPPY